MPAQAAGAVRRPTAAAAVASAPHASPAARGGAGGHFRLGAGVGSRWVRDVRWRVMATTWASNDADTWWAQTYDDGGVAAGHGVAAAGRERGRHKPGTGGSVPAGQGGVAGGRHGLKRGPHSPCAASSRGGRVAASCDGAAWRWVATSPNMSGRPKPMGRKLAGSPQHGLGEVPSSYGGVALGRGRVAAGIGGTWWGGSPASDGCVAGDGGAPCSQGPQSPRARGGRVAPEGMMRPQPTASHGGVPATDGRGRRKPSRGRRGPWRGRPPDAAAAMEVGAAEGQPGRACWQDAPPLER